MALTRLANAACANEPDNADEQMNPATHRGRFIAPTADVSASAG
jgi:hypothetical protein